MQIYTFDADRIYSGMFEVTDPFAPVPPGTEIEPPALTGAEVAQFADEAWRVLPARPVAMVPVIALDQLQSQGLVKIDADTDALYGAVLGNRAQEYALAETDAQAYKTAGYTGTAPSSVQSWATAKGWMPAQAADNILLTAAQWRGAQTVIRASRLARKEEVRLADAAGIDKAMLAWAEFVAYMRSQLGLL